MLKETDYKFYTRIKHHAVHSSEIPVSVLKSDFFATLLNGNILMKEKAGRGFIYRVNNKNGFEKFLSTVFPDAGIIIKNKSDNAAVFRDSKATYIDGNKIVFLRGYNTVFINDKEIELAKFTKDFGVFSAGIKKIQTEKICFVENLDTFLMAEKIIPKDFIFLHSYGRIGNEILKRIEVNEILVFSDYDFVGLNEYLKIKNNFKNVNFFVPGNYDELFIRYSKPLENKEGQRQKPGELIKKSEDNKVVKIREQVLRTNRFLEQQIVVTKGAVSVNR